MYRNGGIAVLSLSGWVCLHMLQLTPACGSSTPKPELPMVVVHDGVRLQSRMQVASKCGSSQRTLDRLLSTSKAETQGGLARCRTFQLEIPRQSCVLVLSIPEHSCCLLGAQVDRQIWSLDQHEAVGIYVLRCSIFLPLKFVLTLFLQI